jgi:U11/U12 small nuclear ribonucleoprotein SNRNP65
MNKMNLPCPFVPYVREPYATLDLQVNPNLSESKTQQEMEISMSNSTSSESELETENEEESKSSKAIRRNELKEVKFKASSKKIKSLLKSTKLAPHKENNNKSPRRNTDDLFDKISEQEKQNVSTKASLNQIEYDRVVIKPQNNESFPKILPLNQQNLPTEIGNKIQKEQEPKRNDFISKEELEQKRLKLSELKDLPVFKNYSKGEKTSRLYIKNVSKKVTQKDLEYVYRRFVDFSTDLNAFTVRLLQEGRMKGQAFVTFSNEDQAEKALNETNGLVIDEKPIVVQFAKSAKISST